MRVNGRIFAVDGTPSGRHSLMGASVRFLQGTADTSVSTETAIKLLYHADSPDMRLTLVDGADHSFSSDVCLPLITANGNAAILDILREELQNLLESPQLQPDLARLHMTGISVLPDTTYDAVAAISGPLTESLASVFCKFCRSSK